MLEMFAIVTYVAVNVLYANLRYVRYVIDFQFC